MTRHTHSHTQVGACQTASHGSGFVPPTPDYIIAMTIVNANGEIKYYDRSHPDLRVMAACLGMCGIVLDVTVKVGEQSVPPPCRLPSVHVPCGWMEAGERTDGPVVVPPFPSLLRKTNRANEMVLDWRVVDTPLSTPTQFNPDTSATKVTQKKLNYQDLIPPRHVPITESYNPLKSFIEGHNGGGAINYAPYNSGVFKGLTLDKNKIDEYHG